MSKLSVFVVLLLGTSLAHAEHAPSVEEARELAHTLTSTEPSVVMRHVVDFAPGRVRVYSKGREKIQAIVESWRTHGWSVITVHGYADAVALGQRRADKIRGYLVRYGVPPELVVAIGHASAPGDAVATAELSIDVSASRRASEASLDRVAADPPRSPTPR